jgi:uncharacterized protein YbjT (DUF2867 family)
MKIVVIGGTGLIGSQLVVRLRSSGHEVIAASPSAGINTLTGEGLAAVLRGAKVVVDVSNSPSFEDRAVMEFFETSNRNLLAAEAQAGVQHHVALSVVGTERLLASGYFRAKMAQEQRIASAGIAYTIVRATQFFEFLGAIAQFSTVGDSVRVSPALIQPIASDDVAAMMAEVSLGAPLNGMLEIAGPEAFRLNELMERYLLAIGNRRDVISDVDALYSGVVLNDRSLTPDDGARLGSIAFDSWIARSKAGQ